MNAYVDTSFLMSLYARDSNTLQAVTQINRLNPTILLTPLGELELANAMELRIFRQEATAAEVKLARAKILEHVDTGFFTLQAMPANAYERARSMAHRRSARLGVRSLDILHVACALLLRAEVFLSFDLRQNKLARAEGLKTA